MCSCSQPADRFYVPSLSSAVHIYLETDLSDTPTPTFLPSEDSGAPVNLQNKSTGDVVFATLPKLGWFLRLVWEQRRCFFSSMRKLIIAWGLLSPPQSNFPLFWRSRSLYSPADINCYIFFGLTLQDVLIWGSMETLPIWFNLEYSKFDLDPK